MKTDKFLMYALLSGSLLAASCNNYLDLKPDKKMAVPSSASDLQLMLDNYNLFNSNYPYAFGIMADDYFVTTEHWAALSNQMTRNLYIWQPDENTAEFWSRPYTNIYTLNVVLEEAERIVTDPWEYAAMTTVKGSALFLRAIQYFALTQLFTKPYQAEQADNILGLPLHTQADYSVKSVRASLSDTYELIIHDLEQAIRLLPERSSLKSRPSKVAAYGMLSKVYLSMCDYEKAGRYADSCLSRYDRLLDYNLLDTTANAPMPAFNEEVLFQMRSTRQSILINSRAKVDSTLYRLYDKRDIRSRLFFVHNPDNSIAFKGDYDGRGTSSNGYVFSGVITDEMFLIRSECHARQNQLEKAADDLNHLLATRWETGKFEPLRFLTADEAITAILEERRKQLLFRDSRWIDIRRLSLDPKHAITPTRQIEGRTYSLDPPDGYVLLIPNYVIERSGIQQN